MEARHAGRRSTTSRPASAASIASHPRRARRARARAGSHRNRSGAPAARTTCPCSSATPPACARRPAGRPQISFEQMLDDLLDYWRAHSSAAPAKTCNVGVEPSDRLAWRTYGETYRDSPWKSPRSSSISASPKPTTRQIADLVKAGGADALTEAIRRADAARYQEVRCRSALNRVKGMPFEWTLNPVPRLHARLPLLLRAPLPHAVRARRRRRVRVGHLRQDELRRGAAARAAEAVLDAASYVAVGTATDCYQPIEGLLQADARRRSKRSASSATRRASSPRDR